MIPSRPAALAIAILFGTLAPGARPAQRADELQRALTSETLEERRTAYASVARLEGEEREAALRVLRSEHRRWSGAFQRARRRADQLVSEPGSATARRREWTRTWEEAAREAMAAIHDRELFPDPPGPVSGPFTGYEAVMKKVGVAVERHDRLRERARKDLRSLLQADEEDLEEWNAELHASYARTDELAQALTELGTVTAAPTGPAPLKVALLALAARDWDHALPFHGAASSGCQRDWTGPDEPEPSNPFAPPDSEPPPGPRVLGVEAVPLAGYERFLFQLEYAHLVETHNARVDEDYPRVLRAAVRINNLYRQRLGVRPLQLHAALNLAMRDHLRASRELSHEGATPETRTPRQRVVLAGYPNPNVSGENLSSSALSTAMEHWKWDGGHHRILVQPCAVHIGAYDSGNSGMVVGSGEEPALPAIVNLVFDL